MPLIIAPEPNPSPDVKPLYRITSNHSLQIALVDYTGATIAPAIDYYYNNYEDRFEYTLNLQIPIKVPREVDKENYAFNIQEDSLLLIIIETTNYSLAIHIFNQLLAGKDITPDSLRDELPEVFL